MLRKPVIVIVVLLGLAPVGCGDASRPLTRAQFAQRANVICKRRAAALEAARQSGHGDISVTARIVLPHLTSAYAALSALRPPASFASAFKQILGADREQIDTARALAAHRKPPNPHESAHRLHERENMRAQLGISACN